MGRAELFHGWGRMGRRAVGDIRRSCHHLRRRSWCMAPIPSLESHCSLSTLSSHGPEMPRVSGMVLGALSTTLSLFLWQGVCLVSVVLDVWMAFPFHNDRASGWTESMLQFGSSLYSPHHWEHLMKHSLKKVASTRILPSGLCPLPTATVWQEA